jgi:superfamily I DNA/RNA helicase
MRTPSGDDDAREQGLNFPCAPRHWPAANGQDEQAEAQLFYVASTRATSQLILTSSADSLFSRRLAQIE